MDKSVLLDRLFIGFVLFAWDGFASGAEIGLTTEAHAPAEGNDTYFAWFLFVTAVWFVVVVANNLASSPPDKFLGYIASIGEGPVAHHLYFPCRVGRCPGHLRTMSLRRAEVLVGAGLRRGEWLDLEVAKLKIRAKVLRVSRIQRNGEHLVLLLLRPGDPPTKAAMREIISEWTGLHDVDAGKPLLTRRARRCSQRPLQYTSFV